MQIESLINKKFGRLTVIQHGGFHKFPSGQKQTQYICKCDCGNTVVILRRNLITGNTKSCGCLSIDHKTHHSKWGSSIYKCWDNMRSRCTNPNSTGYKNWGGRGIKVCDEWLNSFDAFYDYVSKLPHFGEKGRQLDRINNDGNYEPNNVRWATRSEQMRNSRNCLKVRNN